jgi:hypothetical protein
MSLPGVVVGAAEQAAEIGGLMSEAIPLMAEIAQPAPQVRLSRATKIPQIHLKDQEYGSVHQGQKDVFKLGRRQFALEGIYKGDGRPYLLQKHIVIKKLCTWPGVTRFVLWSTNRM